MDKDFDIQKYLSDGVEQVVKDALKATLRDPRESAFLGKFALAAAIADKKRAGYEKDGLHVPSYLIASITSSCNLHCAGCYSRANKATVDCEPVRQLSEEEWLRIFREAEELGVSFILLAGGEPMLRWDVIEATGEMQNIICPIFTNGTYMGDKYMDLLDRCRAGRLEQLHDAFLLGSELDGADVALARERCHLRHRVVDLAERLLGFI